jgi:hypothetical protein
VSRAESATVNASGLVQGIALVTFPVAAVMGGLSLTVAHRQPSPATVHPRPA